VLEAKTNRKTVSTVLVSSEETVETVLYRWGIAITPLKRGINEKRTT
jgi:hypothetical protein